MNEPGPEPLCPICWKTDREQANLIKQLENENKALKQRCEQLAELAIKRQWKIEELENER